MTCNKNICGAGCPVGKWLPLYCPTSALLPFLSEDPVGCFVSGRCWISCEHQADLWPWLDIDLMLVCDGSGSCGSLLIKLFPGQCGFPGWSWESGSSGVSDVSDCLWDCLWFSDGGCGCGCFDGVLDCDGSDGWQCESRCNFLCSFSALCANMMLTFLWCARASSLSFSYRRKYTISYSDSLTKMQPRVFLWLYPSQTFV